MAQLEQGVVFDIGRHALPAVIQCRKCGGVLELEPEQEAAGVR
jgi:hypothetical protein